MSDTVIHCQPQLSLGIILVRVTLQTTETIPASLSRECFETKFRCCLKKKKKVIEKRRGRLQAEQDSHRSVLLSSLLEKEAADSLQLPLSESTTACTGHHTLSRA